MYKEKPAELEKVVKANQRINLVGIELEGGWSTLPNGTSLVRDSSVLIDPHQPNGSVLKVGELPSPPLELTEWEKWIRKMYPQVTNPSCGMHIHMSFKNALAYQKLMVEQYPSTIVAYVTKWAKDEGLTKTHPIWPRLEGKSEYCQHTFSADLQIQNHAKDYDHHRPGNRYSVIVYHYNRLRTIECRLLPMMANVDLAIRALQNIIDTTNKFLVASTSRERSIAATSIEDETAGFTEHRRIRV